MALDSGDGQGSIDIQRDRLRYSRDSFGPIDRAIIETLFTRDGVASWTQDHQVRIDQPQHLDGTVEESEKKSDLREHQYDRKTDPKGV
jgi:hypothetical protein